MLTGQLRDPHLTQQQLMNQCIQHMNLFCIHLFLFSMIEYVDILETECKIEYDFFDLSDNFSCYFSGIPKKYKKLYTAYILILPKNFPSKIYR